MDNLLWLWIAILYFGMLGALIAVSTVGARTDRQIRALQDRVKRLENIADE
jgi:hypothetical protein